MKYRDFTEFLNVEKFFKDEPQTLDDEWPDAYENWFDKQDPYDLIKWADEFAKIQIESSKTSLLDESISKEPIIHSHITDCLPESHRLANESVSCDKCKVSLHAFNNECMQTWLETEGGNFCTKCYPITEVLDNGIGEW